MTEQRKSIYIPDVSQPVKLLEALTLVHISGDTAWIAYVNKGSITDASGTAKQNWLESAFLEKQAGNWKIVFMHSTRVPMKLPENQGK